ncbi:MAG: hypothetical protein ACXVX8_18075 [Blastococcus sp.]
MGIVRISAANDPQAETLRLVEVATLSRGQLDQVDGHVRELDRRAYRISRVYAATGPIRVG